MDSLFTDPMAIAASRQPDPARLLTMMFVGIM
jgi:hypothetical protein